MRMKPRSICMMRNYPGTVYGSVPSMVHAIRQR